MKQERHNRRPTCPATERCGSGEREPQRPYIQCGKFQAWYATLRGQKGTYGSTKLATRATPEPEPTPVRVGWLMANVGTGAERP
jgi:hypothetical protein